MRQKFLKKRKKERKTLKNETDPQAVLKIKSSYTEFEINLISIFKYVQYNGLTRSEIIPEKLKSAFAI